MMGISKIPLVTFLYVYTFLQIKLSQQVDGEVKRMVRLNSFLVNGRNPLDLEKCPDNSEFVYLQSFCICKKSVNRLNEHTQVWFTPEHEPPSSGQDTVDTYSYSKNPLLRSYHNYCKQFFDKKKVCSLNINKVEGTVDRFRTEEGLDCKGEGTSLYNGVYFCIETKGSPVEEGEEVTLVGFKDNDIEAWCPEDRKIQTVSAFESSSPLVNKGMLESVYDEATKKCNGNEKCTLSVEEKDRFKRFLIFTYRCVE